MTVGDLAVRAPATFRAMGCDVVVSGASPDELDAVRDLFTRRERTLSRFRPDSELSLLNASPSPAIAVSATLAETLHRALEAAVATGGLVDPTLAAALEHAGYDRDFALVSGGGALRTAVPGRWRELRLWEGTVGRPPGVRLDLNGVAKGLAVDDALTLLSGEGLVSAGGDIAVRGPALVSVPGGGTVRLLAGGMATSGTDRRRWERDGELQHHLIDPRTGRPSLSPWLQVTVAAGSCFAADVAAKAAFLLGRDGPAWLDDRGLPGRFVSEDGIVGNRAWHRACTGCEVAWEVLC